MTRTLAPVALAATLLAGCAHQIVITPDVTQLQASDAQPIDKNVGYYISAADRDLKVTTPGGGGDKITYQPYKELEPALFKVLSNVFRRAYPLQAEADPAELQAKDVSLVIVPTVSTDSKGESLFFWPPTKFTVNLSCKIVDGAGAVVWEKAIVGEGAAEPAEYMKDMPLAARRASLDALTQLQQELASTDVLRGPPAPPSM